MQGAFAESSLRNQARGNPKEGKVGCLHQKVFTRKVTDIAFTSDFCNNYSHPASPASLCLTFRVPVPHAPAFHTKCLQVPRLASLSPKSPHTRPNVPVPLSPSHFYTQPAISVLKTLTGSRAEKSSKCHKTRFRLLSPA